MADVKYEIKEHIGVLSESGKGWKKEVNLISWNGATPKYDIRDWSPDHEKMGKGVTLSKDELRNFLNLFSDSGQERVTNPHTSESSNSGSLSDLIARWDDVVEDAPETIKQYLISSRLNTIDSDRVAIGLKKGSAFAALSDSVKKEILSSFIEKSLGRRVKVELIESSWL